MIQEIYLGFKLVEVVLGLILTGITFITYREKREPYLAILTIGFLFMTIAMGIEELLVEISNLTIDQIHLIEAIMLLIGFINVWYALFVE